MGGGGSYYDRDTRDGYARSSRGVSADAEEKMSRRTCDPGLLPKDRTLVCDARSPVVYAFDVTGSMGNLPKIIFDKMPLIAGQIVECGYLQDAKMSLAAVGDILSDQAPIQVAEFSVVRKLDDWLKRIWLEGNGGGQDMESYEFMAYYYARMCEMPKAATPFFIFTGDEDYRETLYASDLKRHFGGAHRDIEAADVFEELKEKFRGNVFLVHRTYNTNDEKIVAHWQKVLGKERVVRLGTDQAIADVTLGIFALMTGARTLDEYLVDLKTKRAVAQTDARVAEVRKALQGVATLKPLAVPAPAPRKPRSAAGGSKKTAAKGKNRKPGRL